MAGSWVCIRCGVVNAPHVSQCSCPRKIDAEPRVIPAAPPADPHGPTIPRVERGRTCLSADAFGDVT